MKQLTHDFIEIEMVEKGKVAANVIKLDHVIRVFKGPKENAFLMLTERNANGTVSIEYNGTVEEFSKGISELC
ncbi:MAG: hypothetical protein ACYS8W_08460 [Planctomycetota bacterium]|jgi:hypothetical protein